MIDKRKLIFPVLMVIGIALILLIIHDRLPAFAKPSGDYLSIIGNHHDHTARASDLKGNRSAKFTVT